MTPLYSWLVIVAVLAVAIVISRWFCVSDWQITRVKPLVRTHPDILTTEQRSRVVWDAFKRAK